MQYSFFPCRSCVCVTPGCHFNISTDGLRQDSGFFPIFTMLVCVRDTRLPLYQMDSDKISGFSPIRNRLILYVCVTPGRHFLQMDYDKISGFFPMEWIMSGDFGWGFNKKKKRLAEEEAARNAGKK